MHKIEGIVSASSHTNYTVYNEQHQSLDDLLDLYNGLKVRVTIELMEDNEEINA